MSHRLLLLAIAAVVLLPGTAHAVPSVLPIDGGFLVASTVDTELVTVYEATATATPESITQPSQGWTFTAWRQIGYLQGHEGAVWVIERSNVWRKMMFSTNSADVVRFIPPNWPPAAGKLSIEETIPVALGETIPVRLESVDPNSELSGQILVVIGAIGLAVGWGWGLQK